MVRGRELRNIKVGTDGQERKGARMKKEKEKSRRGSENSKKTNFPTKQG